MRHRYQRTATDCVPTSVSIITGLSWKKAVRVVHPTRKPRQSYTTKGSRIHEVFRGLGYKTRTRKRVKTLLTVRHPAVVSIKWKSPHAKSLHAVVWDPEQKKVLDPLYRNFSRRFYEERIVGVIMVTKKRC